MTEVREAIVAGAATVLPNPDGMTQLEFTQVLVGAYDQLLAVVLTVSGNWSRP